MIFFIKSLVYSLLKIIRKIKKNLEIRDLYKDLKISNKGSQPIQ